MDFCILYAVFGRYDPWYIVMKAYGLTNSVFGLAVCGGIPVFNLILMVNFFQDIPEGIGGGGDGGRGRGVVHSDAYCRAAFEARAGNYRIIYDRDALERFLPGTRAFHRRKILSAADLH